jgi:tetratricopeptide (TPR) repeat protein
VLLAVAGVEADLGRYAESGRHAREAASMFRTLGHLPGVASALNRAGLAAMFEGSYRDAEHAIRSALEVSTRLGDQDSRAEQLGNLGNVYFFVGRYADAARLYEEALTVTAASSTQRWASRRRRILLANQATLYQRLGRDERALEVYRALGTSHRELRPNEHAQLLTNLGVLYRRLGDPVKALATYDQARILYARERHVDGELGVLKNRGIVLALDLRRFGEAERSFTDLLATATMAGNRREILHARLYRGETRLRTGRAGDAHEDFAAALVLAGELRTPEEEWKALYGLGRTAAGSSDAIEYYERALATIEQVRENIRIPSLRVEFLNDKRDVYDSLIAAQLADATPAHLFGILERSHSRAWRERLGLEAPVDLEALQTVLPNGVLLLDYWNASAGSAVIAVTRTRAQVIHLEADRGRIETLIETLASGPSSRWQDAASFTSRLLPSGDWLQGIEHVIVVPDGALALVPFELASVNGRLLIERAAVSYTPTAATLLRRAPPGSGPAPPWRLQLRAFADPVFASASLEDRGRQQHRLGASAEEVRRVLAELTGRAALHLGKDNRKEYLLSTDERAPILHLATHAIADANAMERSRLLFSPPSGGGASADYLFLKEAYDLPLDGVEMAVLSACETERGKLVRGEGVQSFSRAFLASGARSTVTTLWRVADRPTADFMGVFYHHLQKGLPRDEALRRAKLRFLATGTSPAHPHFWAAFVLTGDAIRPVPRPISWTAVAGMAILLASLVAIALRVVRRRLAAVPRSRPPVA